MRNSRYIKQVIESCKENPVAWATAWNRTFNNTTDGSWHDAWNKTIVLLNDNDIATFNQLFNYNETGSRSSARSAVMALLVYDCGYMLDEKLKDIELLCRLGNLGAILMYPACLALSS